MNSFKIKSYAKINLALNVTGKKSKLHNIESLISFINLHDSITLRESKIKQHKINFRRVVCMLWRFGAILAQKLLRFWAW